jgi:hypothetical protein
VLNLFIASVAFDLKSSIIFVALLIFSFITSSSIPGIPVSGSFSMQLPLLSCFLHAPITVKTTPLSKYSCCCLNAKTNTKIIATNSII